MVHVLPPGDARMAGVLGPQVQRADMTESGVQVLVVTPSAETAAWVARLVNPTLGAEQALLVPVTSPTRGARLVSGGARAVAVTPADALALVRGSALKLDGVSTLVLVDANDLLAGDRDAVATLLSEIPREADRVLIAQVVDETISAFLEAHMRRPRTIAHDVLPTAGGSLRYLVAQRGERSSALRRVLDSLDPPRATLLVAEPFAGAAARALAAIGVAADDSLVRLRTGAIDAHEPLVICFGAPQSAAELQALAEATPQTIVVLVAPEELAAFLRLTGARATPLSLSSVPTAARAAEETMRDELRAMMGARALHRETLALEPLLAEHDALEIAAAALRMLELERERARAKRPTKSIEQPVAIPVPNERVAPVGTSYTKLFINVGERDGARKGDFVGAITGEAGVTAEQIGKVDLRDSHTIVDVASDVAEKVIAALNGSTISGRHVLAREDRGPTEGGEREQRTPFREGDKEASAVVRRAARLRAAEGFAVTIAAIVAPRVGVSAGDSAAAAIVETGATAVTAAPIVVSAVAVSGVAGAAAASEVAGAAAASVAVARAVRRAAARAVARAVASVLAGAAVASVLAGAVGASGAVEAVRAEVAAAIAAATVIARATVIAAASVAGRGRLPRRRPRSQRLGRRPASSQVRPPRVGRPARDQRVEGMERTG